MLELLVALTLMSLLVTMLFAGLRFGARVWDSEAAHSTRMTEVRLVQDFLRRQLEQAWSNSLRIAEDNEKASFQGDSDRLRFVAVWPSSGPSSRLYQHELYMSDAGAAGDLVIALSPYGSDSIASDAAAQVDRRVTVLLHDVETVAFRYFGSSADDDVAIWQTDWQERRDLPALVTLQIGLGSGTNRSWPALVIALRHTVSF